MLTNPGNLMGPRKKSVGAGSSFNSNALAYFTAAGITDPLEKEAANTLINALQSNDLTQNYWGSCDRIYLVSTTSAAAALMCCKTLTSMTNHGAGFGSDGWHFDGSTWLDTNVAANALTNYTQNSAHLCYYINELESASTDVVYAVMGCQSGSGGTLSATSIAVTLKDGGNNRILTGTTNSNTGVISPLYGSTNPYGVVCAARQNSTVTYIMADSIVTADYEGGAISGVVSRAPPTTNIFIGNVNVAGAPGYPNVLTCGFASIGSVLNYGQTFHVAPLIDAYRQAIGGGGP